MIFSARKIRFNSLSYLHLVRSCWRFNMTYLFCLLTDLNPCLGVHCPSFGICKTYSAHDARCVCYEDCPSYQDPVCTANGTTYDNKCWHQLNYCRGLENNLVYHPGSCEGKWESWMTEWLIARVRQECNAEASKRRYEALFSSKFLPKNKNKVCFVGNKIGFQLLLNNFSFEVRRKMLFRKIGFSKDWFFSRYTLWKISLKEIQGALLDFKIFRRACL